MVGTFSRLSTVILLTLEIVPSELGLGGGGGGGGNLS